MQDAERLLAREVCHAMVSKLAFLAGSGQKDVLEAIGMDDDRIAFLESMSNRDLNRWVKRCHNVDIKGFVDELFSDDFEMPKEWREFLSHGANNKMMKHYFGARPADCSICRDDLTVLKPYRARVIGNKQHRDVCKTLAEALKEVDNFRQLSSETLLNVAQTHQVSLGALWNELEKWEKQNEQKNSKA
ncbi:DUF2857 family protein [Vibrio parahaemolyticus]|nr:DUF2857 family protein [Vibrio parahaemolyticus]